MKVPSSKFQAPNKHQTPNSNILAGAFPTIIFGIWNFSGAWSLELGAF
jgi:hypothetical protein